MPPFMLLPYHPTPPKKPVATTTALANNGPSSSVINSQIYTPATHRHDRSRRDVFCLPPIPELSSWSASSSHSAPSPKLVTPRESPGQYTSHTARARAVGWLSSWFGAKKATVNTNWQQEVNPFEARVTIERLPFVPIDSDTHVSDSDVSTFDLDERGSGSDDSDDSSDESSTWSAIIPRDVFYSKTWIAGSQSDNKVRQGYSPLRNNSLEMVRAEIEKEKVERMDHWFSTSDLSVGGTHQLIRHLMCHSSPTIHVRHSCQAQKQPLKRQKSTIALRQILSQSDLKALKASYKEHG
ncbi:hypothetical protein IAR50_004992 [Cryptococcus sp. DSM 104548]